MAAWACRRYNRQGTREGWQKKPGWTTENRNRTLSALTDEISLFPVRELRRSLARFDWAIYDMYIFYRKSPMSRILVDLPEAQVAELAALVKTERRSRASIIRQAIEAYLAQRKQASGTNVFGLWKDRKTDGLAYQQEIRSEW
jgi:hypothetical protein